MSQYLNFYICKNSLPVRFLSFSRSSKVYSAFDDFSKWEYPTLLSKELLQEAKNTLNLDLQGNLKDRQRYENTKNDLLTCPPANVAESLVGLYEILDSIDDEREEIEFAKSVLDILGMMLWDKESESEIYFGVELSEVDFVEYFKEKEKEEKK